ncbi:potassium transporter TrkA, partial [Halolamina salina]|uniref:potassium transporter TrkA n=1 Tax=Halolamina salina TaxID=1220023 RepID=UPI0036088936
MASFPLQVLLGVYLGLVTGIVPALVSWGLGFAFKYFTNVTIPGFGTVVLALAIAGVNGGLLALNDKAITNSTNGVAVLVAIVVVLMLSMYAHAKGDQMGAATPKRLTLKKLAGRTLSSDVVEFVGNRGQVKLNITGEVGDLEGYPPLPAELRAEIREASIALPADLPISELEHRAEDQLRTEFDLVDASVRIDERGHATVAAAPPTAERNVRRPVAVSSPCITGYGAAGRVKLPRYTHGGDQSRTTSTGATAPSAIRSASPPNSEVSTPGPPSPITITSNSAERSTTARTGVSLSVNSVRTRSVARPR